jgi:phenylacetate-CoA ligase
MAFDFRRRLYESLPINLKKGLCLIPFSWWAGKSYRETYRRSAVFERATRIELLQYQEQCLGEILNFVVEQVPAYAHLRQILERLRPFEALKAFPLIDKDKLHQEMDRFLPRGFSRFHKYEVTTGGTSGNQLKLYLDDNSQSIEMGFTHRFWKQMGYTPNRRKATFRGVKFPNLPKDVFWQLNPIYNEIQFSPFHMNEDNMHAYVEEFIRYAPEYLHGYPSAIDTLAEFVIRNNLLIRIPQIKAAFLSSETCTQIQRARIEKAFRTRVFSWYGHTERLVFAGECEKNNSYHHIPDYGILEIVDENDNSCEREGERGEIVGTGLHNWSLPLVRYRTSDYATRLEPKCECGRSWDRFTNVEGRWKQDMIIGVSGSKIPLAALNMHGPLFDRVVRHQYYQEKEGNCVLKVLSAPGFTEKDSLAIKKAFKEKMGNEVLFEVQVVEDIPLTRRGKLKRLDSRVTAR